MNAYKEAQESMGYYPAATITRDKDGKEVSNIKRTPWEDGWNAAVAELGKRSSAITKWYDALSIEHRKLFAVLDDVLDVRYDDKADPSVYMSVDISDTFMWGCSDAEDVTFADLPCIANLYTQFGYDGVVAFIAHERYKMDPMEELITDQYKAAMAELDAQQIEQERMF